MPKFSKRSQQKLEQCHEDLQVLFNDIIKKYDCTIICGYRNEKEQNKAFIAGHSRLKYPESKHNKIPSLAVDVLPCPVSYSDKEKIRDFATYVKSIIVKLIKEDRITHVIKWGGDWKKLVDMPHWEIV